MNFSGNIDFKSGLAPSSPAIIWVGGWQVGGGVRRLEWERRLPDGMRLLPGDIDVQRDNACFVSYNTQLAGAHPSINKTTLPRMFYIWKVGMCIKQIWPGHAPAIFREVVVSCPRSMKPVNQSREWPAGEHPSNRDEPRHCTGMAGEHPINAPLAVYPLAFSAFTYW